VDDVMNVSGHRVPTAEVESTLVSPRDVAEAAVVGWHDENKGQAIFAHVILEGERETSEQLMQELRQHVREELGPTSLPDQVVYRDDLPKTRSGKIMRRILRNIAEGKEDLGDTSTLADPSVVDTSQEQAASQR